MKFTLECEKNSECQISDSP